MAVTLSPLAVRAIRAAVADVFQRVRSRYLGGGALPRGPKQAAIVHRREWTLPGIYHSAAFAERTRPDGRSERSLVDTATDYLNLAQGAAELRATRAVESFVRQAEVSGRPVDLATVLGGQMSEVWTNARNDVVRILDSEATRARNVGLLEGISRVNAAAGVADPAIYFVVVRDNDLCDECRRVHVMPDGVTPRVFRMSEVKHGYHVRGEDVPSWGGLHPHCRCVPATLLPGYGFDEAGHVLYVSIGHLELDRQRG